MHPLTEPAADAARRVARENARHAPPYWMFAPRTPRQALIQHPARSGARQALWMRPGRMATPAHDELRVPLGRWLVACRRCGGWVAKPKTHQIGDARRAA